MRPVTSASALEKVDRLLHSYCGACHGTDLMELPGFYECFCFIDDIDRLVDEGKIVPGNPEASQVYQRMVDGFMPPRGYPAAPPQLIERVGAFIASLCARDDDECQAETDRGN